jgi:hypothetical protein
MVIAIVFMLAGLMGPVAAAEWRRDRWLPAARWIVHNLSIHALLAVPVAGLLVSGLGVSALWPPAIVAAFLCAIGIVAVLMWSVRREALRDSNATRTRSEPEAAPIEQPGEDLAGRRAG